MREITEGSSMKFSEMFVGVTSRSEVVVTFLALLELIRLKQLTAIQAEPFSEIEICRSAPVSNEAAAAVVSAPEPGPGMQPAVAEEEAKASSDSDSLSA